MNILIVNDDGIGSNGCWALFNSFHEKGHDVWMVVPKTEKSAISHAITLRDPLRIEKIQDRVWAVTGTPVDCVIMAFEELLPNDKSLKGNIDLVISGVNAGPNRGDDVLYSGTVAAAIEAMCFGYKAIAISLTSDPPYIWDTAIHALFYLLEKGIADFIDYREILNINIPNVKIEELQGYAVCQTGFRKYRDVLLKQKDNRNKDIYWIGGYNPIFEQSKHEIDYYVTKEKKVSISPLKIDFNNYEKIKLMEKKFNL